VTRRGNRRLPIFFGDDDRTLYLRLLREGGAAAEQEAALARPLRPGRPGRKPKQPAASGK
jgi:hypothetical protein